MVTQAILAPKDEQVASSGTTSLLSWAILLGGFLTLAVALYLVVTTRSSLPFWDGWAQIEPAATGVSPLSPAWLWRQHNEHRLILPKLFLAADLELFQARQIFLLASILAIQLLHWGLLGWSMRVLGGWRGPLWRTGVGLAAFCLFCPAQWQNFVWGFQVCFVLPQLFATASFVALLLYSREAQQEPATVPHSRFLVLSVLAALGATYSLANGTLLWPLLVLAALCLRLRARAVLSFALTGTISTVLYLHHYVRPEKHADPITSLKSPLTLLKYWARYFSNSWTHPGIHPWEVIALAALLVLLAWHLRALSGLRAFRPFAVQLALTLLFCAGTALLTATGRSNFGVGQALASRYQTVALLFWCCLGLLWLGATWFARSRMPHAFLMAQLCLLLIFARAAALARYPLMEAGQHAFSQSSVTAALVSGVYDQETLSRWAKPELDMLLREVPYIRANRLSVFSGELPSELGKPVTSVFPASAAGECVGFVKAVTPIDDASGRGLRLAGWVWDTKHHRLPSAIVVASNGTITGLGAAGGEVANGHTLYPGISSDEVVFLAFFPEPQPGALVNVYAILPGRPATACYFDGWRQTFDAGPHSPGGQHVSLPLAVP